MPTYLDNLKTAREQIAANLAEMTASPKPSYTIDGQTVSWQGLFDSYIRQLEQLDARIAAGEPFEFETQAGSDA